MKFVAAGHYQQVLMATLVHMETHLDDELCLPELARRAGFSPFHFHRVFTQFVGEPIKQYVRRLRLERAAYRLKISDGTVLEIALEAGFRSHEAFTRAFARQFGLSPRAYRENYLRAIRVRAGQPGVSVRRPPTAFAAGPALLANGATEARVRLVRTRPLLVAFIRHVGPYADVLEPGSTLASLWAELFQWGRATALIGADSLLLGIPQDDPGVTAPRKQRFDVGVQVPAFREPTGSVGCQTLQAGLYAVARHYGSFEKLAETYAHIYDTEIASGKSRMRLAPPFEVYGHTRVNDELTIHHTDVYLPVEATGGSHRPAPGDRS